jgi:hypothetical protein
VILANLIVLAGVGGLLAGIYFLGWQFSVGAVVGMSLFYFAVRLKYGVWLFNEEDD